MRLMHSIDPDRDSAAACTNNRRTKWRTNRGQPDVEEDLVACPVAGGHRHRVVLELVHDPDRARDQHTDCQCGLLPDMGIMFSWRLVMLQIEPVMTRKTISSPKKRATMLFGNAG
jgi:hypothetical protein